MLTTGYTTHRLILSPPAGPDRTPSPGPPRRLARGADPTLWRRAHVPNETLRDSRSEFKLVAGVSSVSGVCQLLVKAQKRGNTSVQLRGALHFDSLMSK